MMGLAASITATRAKPLRRSRALIGLVWVFEAVAIAVAALALVLATLADAGWDRAAFSIVLAAFTTVGGLIATRQLTNPIGWIYCCAGLAGGVSVFAEAYAQYGIEQRPYPLTGTVAMAWLAFSLPPLATVPLLTFGFLLFPDGRLPSRRWRPLAWVAGGATVVLFLNFAIAPVPLYGVLPSAMNPVGVSFIPLELMRAAGDVSFLVCLGCVVASVGAMVVRLRRAGGELRQQLKWMTYGAFLVTAAFVSGGLLDYFADVDIGGAPVFAFAAFPVTACVAILKYRLYDIDVVISKTVIYGTLAVFIASSYVAIVVGGGTAIGAQGEPRLVVSILGAALVAAVFQPVRERVERWARRLVYGERTTPYDVLARFTQRIVATYPSGESLGRMARLLAEGTGAASAEVWLRFGDRLTEVAAWPDVGSRRDQDAPRPASRTGKHTVLVYHDGEVLGALAVRSRPGSPLTPAEQRLLADLAGQAGLFLRNVRLIEDLRRSRERLITARDAERRHLQRDIRERVERRLAGMATALQTEGEPDGRDGENEVVMQLGRETASALAELRGLARGVYPPLLADQGLRAALEAHALGASLRVTIEADRLGRHGQDIEAAAYFCCLEALQNIAKHAEARRVTVTLSQPAHRLQFTVEDDGVGFDPAAMTRGSGLQNMADRAEALGGCVEVSSAPGRGTVVSGWLPSMPVQGAP